MLLIRHEMPEDAPEVRSLLIQAFNRPDEADVVEALRSRGAISLALVALVERQVVGHILFSPVTIGAKSSNLKAIGLAPLAVLPDYQGQGIGSQLVQQGLSECRKAGYQIVVVLGEPAFYQRFGFQAASGFGIRYEDVPEAFFLLKELQSGALVGRTGIVEYQPEFRGV